MTDSDVLQFPTKTKRGWFYDELYRMDFHLIFTDDHYDGMVDQFKELDGIELKFSYDFSSGGACTVWENYAPNHVFMFLAERDLPTFAHELVHAVDFAFDSKGISPDVNNNEPYAYYLGFLMEKLWPLVERWESIEKRSRARRWKKSLKTEAD